MPRRDLLIFSIIYFLCCALYILRSISLTEPGFPLDDSWIHQVFARNIATGHGFSFNPGQPIPGATAPLWTLILASTCRPFGPVAGGIATGIAFLWLAFVGLYKLTVFLAQNRFKALLTVILSILCWPVVWGGLSGMEVGLYSCLTFWGLYFNLSSKAISDNRAYLSYFLFTMAFLARPETAVFLGAAVLRDLYEWLADGHKSFSPWLWRAMIIILPLIPYFAFNYHITGNLFPLTFTAKVQHKDLFSSIANVDIKRIVKSLTFYPLYYIQDFFRKILAVNPVVIFASIPGFLAIFSGLGRDKSKMIMFALAVLLYVPLMGTFVPLYTATFQNYRMSANIIPLLMLTGVIGLWRDRQSQSERLRRIILISAVGSVTTGLLIGPLFYLFGHKIASLLMSNPSGYGSQAFLEQASFFKDFGYGIAITGGIVFAGALLLHERVSRLQGKNSWRIAAAATAVTAGLLTFIPKAGLYANNVRNVNECDVEAGRYLRKAVLPGKVVAASDIGAIGYYSELEVVDLKGLISPEITPEMILNDSLAFEYMNRHKRVDYLAIAPNWFKYIPKRYDVFEQVARFVTEDNTILSGDTLIIYKAKWPDSTR